MPLDRAPSSIIIKAVIKMASLIAIKMADVMRTTTSFRRVSRVMADAAGPVV